jgi:hypothetical protein
VVFRGGIDVATEEVMYRLVPFARCERLDVVMWEVRGLYCTEFEPVATVPPIRIKLAIGKACIACQRRFMVTAARADGLLSSVHLRVSSANAFRMYSKITRKTSRKVIMNGKSRRPMVSPRIKQNSKALFASSNRAAEISNTGKMNSSEVITIRNMQPNTASVL